MPPSINHFTTPQFWQLYKALPEEVQELADKNFALLQANFDHPSLHFRRIGPYWTARVGLHYRALAYVRAEGALWFWIGPHAEYDALMP